MSDMWALTGDSPKDISGYKTEYTVMNLPLCKNNLLNVTDGSENV